MPNDAQQFTPTEQAILIALYRWQYDPPTKMVVLLRRTMHESRHPIPSVPFEFLEAELQPDHGGYEIRDSLRILEKLGFIQEVRALPACAEEGDEDYDKEIYTVSLADERACVGLYQLADGRYLDWTFNDRCFEVHKHKIKERVIIDSVHGRYYVLADSALPTVRQLLFAEDHRRAAPPETGTLEAEHGGGRSGQEAKVRDVRAAIEKLGKDAKSESVITEAHIAKKECLNILRRLEKDGEYSGFSIPRRRPVP